MNISRYFSVNDGRSLYVLEMLLKHACLVTADFGNIWREVRLEENWLALAFYNNNLNRMIVLDL